MPTRPRRRPSAPGPERRLFVELSSRELNPTSYQYALPPLTDVVTFWHGPLDKLRQTCLRSQLAQGHKVTVFSFGPIANLPNGVVNADAETILPHAFASKLRPPQSDGSWRDWTVLQFSDFFRMRLMARRTGLWLDADVLLVKPVRIDFSRPFFAFEGPRLLGNSVLYLPPDDPIVAAFERLIAQKELTPDWLSLRHRLAHALSGSRGHRGRLSDLGVAIFGPSSLTALARRSGKLHHALPKRSFYAIHAEPKLFFEPWEFSALIDDPKLIGLHISPKDRGDEPPVPGSLHAWAVEQFGT
jgi:hypothetical protein